ncbi:MAG: Kae1-associated kinase Bud32 [Methanomethylovorans sp.]|uniref:Kae1-associated kinase Bud32 n=1 Tax=Methanomethylovorans sp. TaxID=2758717 RepID=UPI000AC5ABE7|nr:Kae1-associated kinase Bud32 [Methanomethylovorans sp.]
MYLARGAEAVVTLMENTVIKERIPKNYRLREIDERIRKERTRAEARLISEARRGGVPTPIIYDIQDFRIEMQYIEGSPLKHVMNEKMSNKVGQLVGRLHSKGIIHGDLTTSNMIFSNDRIYLIDFGLSYMDNTLEAQGVDVHVLFQTFESTHSNHEKLIASFCQGYRESFVSADDVIERVKEIEKRGRYA